MSYKPLFLIPPQLWWFFRMRLCHRFHLLLILYYVLVCNYFTWNFYYFLKQGTTTTTSTTTTTRRITMRIMTTTKTSTMTTTMVVVGQVTQLFFVFNKFPWRSRNKANFWVWRNLSSKNWCSSYLTHYFFFAHLLKQETIQYRVMGHL